MSIPHFLITRGIVRTTLYRSSVGRGWTLVITSLEFDELDPFFLSFKRLSIKLMSIWTLVAKLFLFSYGALMLRDHFSAEHLLIIKFFSTFCSLRLSFFISEFSGTAWAGAASLSSYIWDAKDWNGMHRELDLVERASKFYIFSITCLCGSEIPSIPTPKRPYVV